jgi:hypothetical protein
MNGFHVATALSTHPEGGRPPYLAEGREMSASHCHDTTTLTTEQFVAGLTEFVPDRWVDTSIKAIEAKEEGVS